MLAPSGLKQMLLPTAADGSGSRSIARAGCTRQKPPMACSAGVYMPNTKRPWRAQPPAVMRLARQVRVHAPEAADGLLRRVVHAEHEAALAVAAAVVDARGRLVLLHRDHGRQRLAGEVEHRDARRQPQQQLRVAAGAEREASHAL